MPPAMAIQRYECSVPLMLFSFVYDMFCDFLFYESRDKNAARFWGDIVKVKVDCRVRFLILPIRYNIFVTALSTFSLLRERRYAIVDGRSRLDGPLGIRSPEFFQSKDRARAIIPSGRQSLLILLFIKWKCLRSDYLCIYLSNQPQTNCKGKILRRRC